DLRVRVRDRDARPFRGEDHRQHRHHERGVCLVEQGEHRILERPQRALVGTFYTSCNHRHVAYGVCTTQSAPAVATRQERPPVLLWGDARYPATARGLYVGPYEWDASEGDADPCPRSARPGSVRRNGEPEPLSNDWPATSRSARSTPASLPS